MSTEYTFKLALTAAIQELVEGGLLKLWVVTSINSNIILSLDVFSSKGSNMHVSIAVVVFFFNIFTWSTILDGTIAHPLTPGSYS